MPQQPDGRHRPPRERRNPYQQAAEPMPGPPRNSASKRQHSRVMAQLVRVGAIGTDFVVAVIIMGALGWLLDWVLGTRPLIFTAGLLMGIVAGFIRFVRVALAENRRAVAEWERKKKGSG